MTKNLIPISIIIAGLLVAGALYFTQFYGGGGKVLPGQEVAQKAIDYINKNFDMGGNTASLVSVAEEGNVYKIKIKIGETEYDSYATKDGKLLFPDGYELAAASEEESLEETLPETTKRDTPDVKLFVMSYCPYGLQAQKMFLPVYDLLKDKAEMGVYFVNYIMHEKKEIDENLRQYCIQKEEKTKYSNYLSCFVASDDYQNCLSEAGINQAKLTNCIFETDRDFNITSLYNNQSTWLNGQYPKFDVNTDLDEQYGVQGSPTVVINDQVIEVSPRSPENFKNIVCQAFNSQPEECSQTLSSEVPSPGIGTGTTSGGSGSCQ